MATRSVTLERVSTRAFLDALGGHSKRTITSRIITLFELHDFVPREMLAEYLYGDAEDGGPEWMWISIHVMMYVLRQRGYQIETVYNQGYRVISRRRYAA